MSNSISSEDVVALQKAFQAKVDVFAKDWPVVGYDMKRVMGYPGTENVFYLFDLKPGEWVKDVYYVLDEDQDIRQCHPQASAVLNKVLVKRATSTNQVPDDAFLDAMVTEFVVQVAVIKARADYLFTQLMPAWAGLRVLVGDTGFVWEALIIGKFFGLARDEEPVASEKPIS